MAHMNQQKKALIAAELKKAVPQGWKYTLAVRSHLSIVMTITQAPIDLVAACCPPPVRGVPYTTVNPHRLPNRLADAGLADVFEAIVGALNTGNWDRSDVMTDYFDVGHYVDLHIGRWDKPFVVR